MSARGETATKDPSTVTTIGVVAVALLALAAVAYERGVLKNLRALTEMKTTELMQSQDTLGSLHRQLQSGERQLAALEAKRAEGPQAAPANRRAGGAAAQSQAQALEKAKADAQRFLATDPSIRQMIEKVARMQYQTLFAPFFRQQNLSSQQIDQLMNAAVETWMQTLAITPGGGIYPTQQEPSPEVLTSILGADGYQELLTYERSLPAVNFAEQVATEAGYASAPLSPAQQDKITEMVAGASESYQNGKNVNLGAVDWEAVLNQIGSAGLSPAQSDALSRMAVNRQYSAALQQAVQARAAP